MLDRLDALLGEDVHRAMASCRVALGSSPRGRLLLAWQILVHAGRINRLPARPALGALRDVEIPLRHCLRCG